MNANLSTARDLAAGHQHMQTRLAPIGEVNAEIRTARITWTTGARVRRFDWRTGAEYLEQLSLEPAHVRLGRLTSGAPLLDTHNRWSLQGVLGVIEEASVDGKRGVCLVRFSERAEVAPIFRDVKDKIIRNASVGYVVHKYEPRGVDEESGLNVRLAVDWEPMEISLVPIGADAGAGVRNQGAQAHNQRGEVMNQQAQQGAASQAGAIALDDAIADLGPRARSFYDELKRKAEIPAEQLERIFVEASSIKDARLRVLDALAGRTDSTQIRGGFSSPYEARDDGNEIGLMAEALHVRYSSAKPGEASKRYIGMRVTDMARMCLERANISTRGLNLSQIVTRALHATGDFPALLTETGNRSLRMAYESYGGGVRTICRRSTVADFRAKAALMLSEAPQLLKVPQGAEFKHGTMAESKESYSLSTFGRIFGISRQALVNDDLGAFVNLAAAYGRAAAEFECQELVTLLTSNPIMSDGIALFHATHKNLAGAGAIDVTTLGAAKEAMRLQKGISGTIPVNVTPKYLVVPAKKETIAQQYLTTLQAQQASNVNPFGGKLELVVDPRLDANSTTAWYVAADPSQIDTIEYSHLEGQEGVRIETRAGFEVDGLEVKAALDFGAGVLDFRGLYKNPGA